MKRRTPPSVFVAGRVIGVRVAQPTRSSKPDPAGSANVDDEGCTSDPSTVFVEGENPYLLQTPKEPRRQLRTTA
jgi:hypothetical protein